MEYRLQPGNIVHEAIEEVCAKNPRLVLMPYEQMKAAAILLAEKVIDLRIYENAFEGDTKDQNIRHLEEELRWLEGSTNDDIIPSRIKNRMQNRVEAFLAYLKDGIDELPHL